MAQKESSTSPEEIARKVRAGQIAPIYYLMGEEPYYIDKVSDFLVDTLLKPEERDFNLTIVYGADVTANQIICESRSFPMLADRRVVLVREAQALKDVDQLLPYVKQPCPTTVLIFCHKHGKLDGRKQVAKEIQSCGVLYESKRVYENHLPGFVTTYLRQHRVELEHQAQQMLCDHVGANLTRLAAEMDKLLLVVPEGGGRITAEMVEQQTGVSKEFNNFELQNALAARDIYKANQIVNYFNSNPRSFALQPTLATLFNFFSDVMLSYYAPDRTDDGVCAWLGKTPWQARQAILPARRNYTGIKVMHILGEIRRTDARSKGVGGEKTAPGELLQELVFYILH